MIHFDKVSEPVAFNGDARLRGQSWLKEHPGAKRPKDYWSAFRGTLADGFGNLCAYSAMYEPVGTVDHFISYNENPNLAYEWDNYRFASGWINSSKGNIRADTILDPFEVQDDWFRILLPSLQLVVNEQTIPEGLLPRARYMLTRLHLRDDERVLRQRREWYRMYQGREITLEGLRKKAPLIARAIDEEGKASG